MRMAYSRSVKRSSVWGTAALSSRNRRTRPERPFRGFGRFGRLVQGSTGGICSGGPLTQSPEPTDQWRIVGPVKSAAWLGSSSRRVRDPRQEARNTRAGAPTHGSTRPRLHERSVPCWSVEAEACDVGCAGPRAAANLHGPGPRKADVTQARQPAKSGHHRPTWYQTTPALRIKTHGFGLQDGCNGPFRGSRGGLAGHDFPANQWWTAAGSNR